MLSTSDYFLAEELFAGFESLNDSNSIQFSNGDDWQRRQKCLYRTLIGNDLLSHFPLFVKIAQVLNNSLL